MGNFIISNSLCTCTCRQTDIGAEQSSERKQCAMNYYHNTNN